jgi:hypothetical protein
MDSAINIVDWFAITIIFITTVVSFIRRNKKGLFPIRLYIVLSLSLNLLSKFLTSLPESYNGKNIEQLIFNINSVVEIFIIYYFLYIRIKGKGLRTSMIILALTYVSTCTFFWKYKKDAIFYFAPALFGIEDLLIIIPCIFYIYEIMKSDLKIDLKSDSYFIVTCGILFYFSVSIPSNLAWYDLYIISPGFDKILILSNNFFYTILILSFLKAFLCPIQEQRQLHF